MIEKILKYCGKTKAGTTVKYEATTIEDASVYLATMYRDATGNKAEYLCVSSLMKERIIHEFRFAKLIGSTEALAIPTTLNGLKVVVVDGVDDDFLKVGASA